MLDVLLPKWTAFVQRSHFRRMSDSRVESQIIGNPFIYWRLDMKKLLALVCVLAVGLLVGCGSEKPKAKAPTGPNPSIDAMKEMGKAATEAAAASEKAAEKAGEAVKEAGAAVEKAAEATTKAASEAAEKAVEEGKKAVEEGKKAAEEGTKAVEDATKKAEEAAKEATK